MELTPSARAFPGPHRSPEPGAISPVLETPVRPTPLAGARSAPRSDPQAIADRLLAIGIVAACVAVALQTVGHLANAFVFDFRFGGLDAGLENNVWSWASSAATFGGAFASAMLAAAFPERYRRFALLAGLLAYFSLDDMIQIHEKAAYELTVALGLPEYLGGRLFPAVYLPLLAASFWLIWSVSRDAGLRLRRALLAGLGLLVLGVAGEGLSAVLELATDGTYGGWGNTIEVAVEEGAELAGWILVAAAFACAAALALCRAGPDGIEES